MSTKTSTPRSTAIRHVIGRYRRPIVLVLLAALVLLATYRRFNTSVAARTAEEHSQATHAEPHPHSLIDYLSVPNIVQPTPTESVALDPAQQGAMNYVRVHEHVEQSPAPWDPLVQAVLDYLRAHSR